jgi:hypothetical protein
MTTAYRWPGFGVVQFEMRILPNLRVFTGPYTPTTQVLDLLGERWQVTLTLAPTVDPIEGAAREAFFDRLKGSANLITLWHVKRPLPQGTLGGSAAAVWHTSGSLTANWTTASAQAATWFAGAPIVHADIAQLASTGTIRTLAGRTLRAGDQFSIGGQLVRQMVDTVANGSGLMPIEFQPRARQGIPAGSAVLFDTPTANFMLKPGTPNVPTQWTPGVVEGASIDLIEVF